MVGDVNVLRCSYRRRQTIASIGPRYARRLVAIAIVIAREAATEDAPPTVKKRQAKAVLDPWAAASGSSGELNGPSNE